MACIEARALRKAYGNTIALDGIDLRVEEGRILGLIGPNGAGKTTALNAILGLTSYQGELRVLGRDPWISPRAVCHVDIESTAGAKARGVYIDSFIPPDRLEAAFVHENIARVRAAASYAINSRAKIVSLGGFSSILIEGDVDQLPKKRNTVFTTGNTLTVGFIVQGIKEMCVLEERNLRRATLLIIGATGDVGSGCARCLGPIVERVLLSARNIERLRRLATELEAEGAQVELATDLQRFSMEADIVICAASLARPSLLLERIAPNALICDAGYPKNLSPTAELLGATVFFGGLGQITGRLSFTPDVCGVLNRHPLPDVVHGCLLEGMALALEGRFEPFSKGRGFITPERVAEMENIAARHGIHLAPFCNADGLLKRRTIFRPDRRKDECVGGEISPARCPFWSGRERSVKESQPQSDSILSRQHRSESETQFLPNVARDGGG